MSSRCCTGFTRSELVRHGVARAGAGLPDIEPGMPAPAGSGLTRRSLLLRGLGAGLAVYGASRLGVSALEEGIARASAGPANPVLVSVFLPGGLDSMSVLSPTTDDRYRSLRPTLRLEPGTGPAFAEDARLMWAPAASALRTLHTEGKVTVATAIGYDHPDQSHFTSRHFWEVGALDTGARHGWLGRYLDRHGAPDNPLQGLSLDSTLSPTLATSTAPVAAVTAPDDFGLWAPGVDDPVLGPLYEAIGDLGRLPTADPARGGARVVASAIDGLRRSLAPFQKDGATRGFTSPVTYPSGEFAHRLAGLAALLDGGLPLRCVTLDAPGGYDTHADQAATLARDVQATCEAVLAFQRDLEARGLADRVLTLLWSEFGRRPQQNATGTDHGAAGAAFLVGTRVAGQQLGSFPGLDVLDAQGNLRATADFRGLYCALLEQWFGVDAAPIVPGASGFARPTLLR